MINCQKNFEKSIFLDRLYPFDRYLDTDYDRFKIRTTNCRIVLLSSIMMIDVRATKLKKFLIIILNFYKIVLFLLLALLDNADKPNTKFFFNFLLHSLECIQF